MDILKEWFPLVAQIGLMIWWMSRINTKVENISKTLDQHQMALDDHIEEDKIIQRQIQAMAVNEANVGGMLSNMALEIKYIRQNLDERVEDHGELLELKLEKQSSDLIIKFRDMLHVAKGEIVAQAGHAAAQQISDALRRQRS